MGWVSHLYFLLVCHTFNLHNIKTDYQAKNWQDLSSFNAFSANYKSQVTNCNSKIPLMDFVEKMKPDSKSDTIIQSVWQSAQATIPIYDFDRIFWLISTLSSILIRYRMFDKTQRSKNAKVDWDATETRFRFER